MTRRKVIPAQAGIQGPQVPSLALDPRVRGGDEQVGASRVVIAPILVVEFS
jgi:hypothetical protein